MDLRGHPSNNTSQQNSNAEEWYLFYSPRSPPCVTFIKEAKKIDNVREKINLIDVDQNPKEIIKDNPWIKQHGLPSLAMNGTVLSGKNLFNWLKEIQNENRSSSQPLPRNNLETSNSPENNEPSALNLGEMPFVDGGGFSELDTGLTGEISTSAYSSIGAKQGCEGMDHEKYEEKTDKSAGISLDDLANSRKKQSF